MFRAGHKEIGTTPAAQKQFKPPMSHQRPAVPFSMPREGGGSVQDRVEPNDFGTQPKHSPSRKYGKHNNRGQYNNYGHRPGNSDRVQNGSFDQNRGYQQSRPYDNRHRNSGGGAGQDGFSTGLRRSASDNRYGADDYDPLESMQSGSHPSSQPKAGRCANDQEKAEMGNIAERRGKQAKRELQELREQAEAKKAEAARKREEEEAVTITRDEGTFHRETELLRQEQQERRRLKSTSTSSSTHSRAAPTPNLTSALSKLSARPLKKDAADLASTNEKAMAYLATLSDDDLEVVTRPATNKDRERAKESSMTSRDHKGKGKERAKDDLERSQSKSDKKKDRKLAKIKKNGFESSVSPEKKKSSDKATDRSSSGKKANRSPSRAPSPTLAELLAQQQEGDEMDAEIERKNEEAKKAKLSQNDDSDIEVVDPNDLATADDFSDDDDSGPGASERGREDTPDELLDTEEIEIDPSTLCPFCDQELPTDPSDRLVSLKEYLLDRPHIEPRLSARNSEAKYLPIVEIASFCQLHKTEKIVVPEGVKQGYPLKIDWKGLPRRIEQDIAPHLSEVILGEIASRFVERANKDWERHKGFKRTNITAEWDSFHFEEPGYYGPRGFECIHSTLRQLFTIDTPILTSANISPLSADFYMRRVLVPETALELIRLDLDLERSTEGSDTAAVVLESSRAFGKAAHGIVEDVEKERIRARKEEKRLEKEREQERKEEAAREEAARDEADRKEAEEEAQRIAAAAPQYRQPKALTKARPSAESNPPPPPPAPVPSSSSKSTISSSKKRARSPDLNDLDIGPSAKPKVKKSTTSAPPQPATDQPKLPCFFAKPEETSKTKSKSKQPIIVDSSLSDDDDDVEITTTSPRKKKKRRDSSPEKQRRAPAPDKKRRASTPTFGSPKKKSKSHKAKREASPIKDQTNTLVGKSDLTRALAACSDIESDIETNFKDKNLEAKKKQKRKR
ncbi:hypothetical protein JCM16303_005260 [Sporobolomyces ruberrimus]